MNPFVIAFRRIIYSIPLKRLLVGLAVFSVLLASFSKAETFENVFIALKTISAGTSFSQTYGDQHWDNICFAGNGAGLVVKSPSNTNYTVPVSNADNNQNNFICFNDVGTYTVSNPSGSSRTLYFIRWNNFSCPSQYTSLECQTEYNLIPISSVDQNYCTTNNLCPTCPSCPVATGNLSQLYINNILHVGAPNIFMNIPEEIDWDYAYTMGGNNMNIDIVGYNQDYEQIEDWIYTNNYKPSSEDFTNIFTNFSNFGGLLIATLFVILVFYFVKKMFK